MKLEFNPQKDFALIKRESDEDILYLEGDVRLTDAIAQIVSRPQAQRTKGQYHTLSLLPFSQIRERGFEAHDDGAKIICMDIAFQTRIAVELLLKSLPHHRVSVGEIGYDTNDIECEKRIGRVIRNEIGEGEGANFVVSRAGRVHIKDMDLEKALAIYGNLLRNETGAYWTYLLYLQRKYFIGATPERHITVEKEKARMNPISGTYRKHEAPTEYDAALAHFLAFLEDPKEVNELFMVVDEELKQMARICSAGGMIVGPLLRNMQHLVHTEYLLSGKTSMNTLQVLRESMYAATVTGSPIESACRVIKKYETEARRYYASALVLHGKDKEGDDYMDSPITIRAMEIDESGNGLFRVGGTLVRDSDPHHERLETEAKSRGLLGALTASGSQPRNAILDRVLHSAEVQESLQRRNQHLSTFWFFNQENVDHTVDMLKGKRIVIIDNEDDFCHMFGHMCRSYGCEVEIVKLERTDVDEIPDADFIVVGPGPGNPTDDSEKMLKIKAIVDRLMADKRKFLAVCLGHQVLCHALGLPLIRKEDPQQGVAKEINFFGHRKRVGFYNTFCAYAAGGIPNVDISADEGDEINAIRSEYFYGLQFHAESILSRDGHEILRDVLCELVSDKEP